MPELAEVAFYAQKWSPGLGLKVSKVWTDAQSRVFRGADLSAFVDLLGCEFNSIRTHGKRMLFGFSKGMWLSGHLGMTGKLSAEDPELRPFAKHDRLIITLESVELIFNDSRHFGRMKVVEDDQTLPSFWSVLPPDVRTDAFDFEYFKDHLSRRPRANVKALLLDQAVCPGVGNWMADEILWRARISPRRSIDSLSRHQPRPFFESIKEVTEDAMRVIAPDWSDPPDSWLFNHRWKDGGICPKTSKALIRETIAGRTTCWSPAWQR
ncbi:MAG: DNA-formamidopyrimidine glycosylase family protein [Verrucomicrobiota bacterium]